MLYNVYFHPENKIKSLEELTRMTIEQFLDYSEALDVILLMKEASEKDREQEAKLTKRG